MTENSRESYKALREREEATDSALATAVRTLELGYCAQAAEGLRRGGMFLEYPNSHGEADDGREGTTPEDKESFQSQRLAETCRACEKDVHHTRRVHSVGAGEDGEGGTVGAWTDACLLVCHLLVLPHIYGSTEQFGMYITSIHVCDIHSTCDTYPIMYVCM